MDSWQKVETVVEASTRNAVITFSNSHWITTTLFSCDEAELETPAEGEVDVDWLVYVSCNFSHSTAWGPFPQLAWRAFEPVT